MAKPKQPRNPYPQSWAPARHYEPPQPLPADMPTPPDKYDGWLDLVAGRKELQPRSPAPDPGPIEPKAAPGTERQEAHEAMEAAVKAARKGNHA